MFYVYTDTLMNSDNFPGTRYNVIHTESDTGQNPSGLKALFWRYTFVNSKSEAMLQVTALEHWPNIISTLSVREPSLYVRIWRL